jgi:hypothetical protein
LISSLSSDVTAQFGSDTAASWCSFQAFITMFWPFDVIVFVTVQVTVITSCSPSDLSSERYDTPFCILGHLLGNTPLPFFFFVTQLLIYSTQLLGSCKSMCTTMTHVGSCWFVKSRTWKNMQYIY